MQLPYHTDYGMTAGELRNKLKGVSNDTPIFIVTNKSDENIDEETGRCKQVHPLVDVQREWSLDEGTGFGDYDRSCAILLSMDDDYYEIYKETTNR